MDELLRRGIQLFNNRQFFRCHEVLEEAWTAEAGPRRLFLQALIHLAVGLYHGERGNREGAVRQLRKGLRNSPHICPSLRALIRNGSTGRHSRSSAKSRKA